MKFRLSNMLVIRLLCICMLCICTLHTYADEIPARPNPPRLVNDLANILSSSEIRMLEDSLVAFDKSQSTQIVVLTIPSLGGYEVADFAYKVGQSWGVGQKGKNNGVVMIVKPKTADSRGQAFISTGYGLEGVLPDITCSRIVNNEMIPHFRENDYASGVVAGTFAIMKAVRGEYTNDNFDEDFDDAFVAVLTVVAIFVLAFFAGRSDKNGKGKGGKRRVSNSDFLTAALFASQLGKSSNSSWGSFSSGSGSFGGFGGGSFGGGGGGGSW
ncbi:MAG: TPM domain-containing protein [Bacteroidales bacterium]|nr:TPM domain-containing protein [Bacteroidales bacterium]